MSSLKELQRLVASFVTERDWDKFHTPKNLAMSIAIEAAEIMELFQWLTIEESKLKVKEEGFKKELAYELADVLIYILSLCSRTDIDLENAIVEKLKINEIRFPIHIVKGKTGFKSTKIEKSDWSDIECKIIKM